MVASDAGAASKKTKGTDDAEPVEYRSQSYDQPINPDLYLIRPGEQILVTFVKSKLPQLALTVGQEGRLVHPTLGTFDLSGKTLSETRQILLPPIREQFNASAIDLSVSPPYLVSISITGAVVNPGYYQVYTSQRVSDLIAAAGGLEPSASTRTIQLFGCRNPLRVDLDRANYLGDLSANPPLYSGFHIVVPDRVLERVQVIGEVNHPRAIELLPGDDLTLLVDLAGGATHRSSLDSAVILGSRERNPRGAGSILAGDVIAIPPRAEISQSRSVTVFGEVAHPGRYDFRDSLELSELVTMAGGVTTRANEGRVTVFRRVEADSWGRLQEARYAISNFVDVEQKGVPMLLRPADSIFVPAKVGYVRVSGKVRNPGLFPYVERKDAKFYVQAAGGIATGTPGSLIALFDRLSGITTEASPSTLVRDGDEVSVAAMEVTQ